MPNCPVSQVMKTGLIHNSPAAQEFMGSMLAATGKSYGTSSRKNSREVLAFLSTIEDNVNQIV